MVLLSWFSPYSVLGPSDLLGHLQMLGKFAGQGWTTVLFTHIG